MYHILTNESNYLQVSHTQMREAFKKGFEVSDCSYFNKNFVLLEEPKDMNPFLDLMFPSTKEKDKVYPQIKSKSLKYIIYDKYEDLPDTLEEFNRKVEILKLHKNNVGKHMLIYDNRILKIDKVLPRRKSYLYTNSSGIPKLVSTNLVTAISDNLFKLKLLKDTSNG